MSKTPDDEANRAHGYPENFLAVSLEDAIEAVQDAIGDWGDGGKYSEPARLRQVMNERMGVIIKELEEKARPMMKFGGYFKAEPLSIDPEEFE